MTLDISGQVYQVERVDPNRVRLTSGKGDVYDVTRGDVRLDCTCPDFRYRHAENPASDGCKHGKAVARARLIQPVKQSQSAVA